MKAKPKAFLIREIREKEFQQMIVDLARYTGWRYFHAWNSMHSAAGWPDLALAKDGRLLFIEVKSARGKVSPAQQEWLAALRLVPGVEVYVWRPAQWPEIEQTLMRAEERAA